MAKRKKKKSDCELPPEGLWIDPSGRRYAISEHLLAIKQRPDIFDLPLDTKHADIPELRQIALSLIESGWVRFRYLDGKWLFEVESARRSIVLIEDILAGCGAQGFEEISIAEIDPVKEYSGTVDDVYERKILRFQSNPRKNPWRLSR